MIDTRFIDSVSGLLKRQAREAADRVAYEDHSRTVRFAQLEQRTRSLAAGLAGLGVRDGQCVAVLLPNSVRWVESALAIVRAGGIVVPISYDASEQEALYRLTDAECVLAVSTAEKGPLLERLRPSAPALRTLVIEGGAADSSPHPALDPLLEDDPHGVEDRDGDLTRPSFILYTSGTTGRAKGVVLTQHGMLWVTAACWVPITGLGPEERLLSPLPLFHSYALDLCVLSTLAAGTSTYLMERFSTSEALRLLGSGRFTMFPAVPTMFHYLLEKAPSETLDLAPLRIAISAGAIMPGPLNGAFERRTGVTLVDGYGITETSTMVTMNWPGDGRVPGSCGIPVPGLAVRIVHPATRKDCAPGEEGELIVRGPNVMLRYHNKSEETARALVDGWYHTGDLARFDANGLITITGRLKELIIRGGQNIAPAEIEEIVTEHPEVLECAAIGEKHESLGEVPVLFVVPKQPGKLDGDSLLALCREKLSRYKVPVRVVETDQIPRTGSGKIMRHLLKKLLD